jgi:hypothetical protein
MQQAIQAAEDEVEDEEDEHLEWARETLTRMCLDMAMNGPAPSQQHMWQASPAVRTFQASVSG